MHNGDPSLQIWQGNAWPKKNFGPYCRWVRTHDGLLIVTGKETQIRRVQGADQSGERPPWHRKQDNDPKRRRIHIWHSDHAKGRAGTHVNLLRIVEALDDLPKAGHQQKYAGRRGMKNGGIVRDVFAR